MPKQFGPQIAMPFCASVRSRVASGPFVSSSKPEASTTAARMPRANACSIASHAARAGIAMTRQSTVGGSSFTDGTQA